MHDLKAIYNKVAELVKLTSKEYFVFDGNSRFYPRKPKMTDFQVICLSIAAECTQITSENLLWSKIRKDYPDMFEHLPHRTKYNSRRKQLNPIMSKVLIAASDMINDSLNDSKLLIDSMPIQTCKILREHTSTICQDVERDEIMANKGMNKSMGGWFIGYKLHLITTESGVYKDFMVTSASVHDNTYLKMLDQQDTHLAGYELLGDRGYIGKAVQLSLFKNLDIKLKIPYRCNQKDFKKYPREAQIKRRKIETVFAQFCDEFLIRINYAKRFEGFFNRLTTKICAKTIKQLNNLLNGLPVNQTKHSLAA